MKRFTQIGLVALLVLVPVGVLLAAKNKSKGDKPVQQTKVSHRSSKQKAANEKLVKELLDIMQSTDNKITFAACAECENRRCGCTGGKVRSNRARRTAPKLFLHIRGCQPVVEDPEPASHHRISLAGDIPREADARTQEVRD